MAVELFAVFSTAFHQCEFVKAFEKRAEAISFAQQALVDDQYDGDWQAAIADLNDESDSEKFPESGEAPGFRVCRFSTED